ncbi:MmyB family transcriptional regulator [Saccharothrix carnea]|uniref:MmyB family transcriptional regulator n=1 Tax=Saccharothrix TaxID=2071 RepID=UPI000AC2A839
MNHDLGEFLRSRRARVRPDDVGLPGGGRRRVPGLRREELALLAGVSVDYYMRLEQGRTPAVSDSVLDAVARVLRLDETERAHLRNLVRPAPAKRPAPQRVRPGLRRLVDMMDDVPAFVMGRRTDILAWNPLAGALYGFDDLQPEDLNCRVGFGVRGERSSCVRRRQPPDEPARSGELPAPVQGFRAAVDLSRQKLLSRQTVLS